MSILKTERRIYVPRKEFDPSSFETYWGQQALKRRIELRLNAMVRGDSFRALFYASFGQGKTSFARTIAFELFNRGLIDHYGEVIAGHFDSKIAVDDFFYRIKPYTLTLIDEIHGLVGTAREAFYSAIQDNVYVFQREAKMVKLPPGLCWIGATTELGQVHQALQRRLIPMMLEPLTKEDLAYIASTQKVPVETRASFEMASRSWSPWEIKDELYATAADVAASVGAEKITIEHVIESCAVLGIDEHGLRPQDRRVLVTLFENPKAIRGQPIYAMARQPLVTLSGLDDLTFTTVVEPKLLKLHLMRISSSGRELTEKSRKIYFNDQN